MVVEAAPAAPPSRVAESLFIESLSGGASASAAVEDSDAAPRAARKAKRRRREGESPLEPAAAQNGPAGQSWPGGLAARGPPSMGFGLGPEPLPLPPAPRAAFHPDMARLTTLEPSVLVHLISPAPAASDTPISCPHLGCEQPPPRAAISAAVSAD